MQLKWIGKPIPRLESNMKLISFILMFLLIGAFFIITENHLALKDVENRVKFGAMYMTWFDKIFDNSSNLAGYVVRLDWLPEKEG